MPRRLFEKKRHSYCIGAPKTGTMSVAEVLGDRFRAAHEPQAKESIDLALAFQAGEIDPPEALELVILRDRLPGLDCEAAHYLVFLLPSWSRLFPTLSFSSRSATPDPGSGP